MRPASLLASLLVAASVCAATPAPASPAKGAQDAAAAATERLDLTGRWTLSLADSDPIGPLLALFGVERATQAVAARTVITQIVRQTGDSVSIEFKSNWRDSSRTIPIDGTLAEDEDPGGRKSWSRTNWGPGRRTIVSRSDLKLADGSKAQFEVTRSRPSEDTMVVTSVLTRAGAEPLTVRRVFRLDTR